MVVYFGHGEHSKLLLILCRVHVQSEALFLAIGVTQSSTETQSQQTVLVRAVTEGITKITLTSVSGCFCQTESRTSLDAQGKNWGAL